MRFDYMCDEGVKDVKATGISASFLSELENGKETIQAGKMMEVISLLGMDVCIRNRGE